MLTTEHAALFLLLGLVLDAIIGDPDWLWRRAPHPVTLMGRLIDIADHRLNNARWEDHSRRLSGIITVIVLLVVAVLVGWLLHDIAALHPVAGIIEVAVVAVLIAQRSLYEHVDRVRQAFAERGLDGARTAVAEIVGRNPSSLDQAGVCRAAIESTAENFSDGVVAPAFWYLVAGLPGIIAYKMINTADSMIGHRTPRHQAFGWAAARLDDLANFIPARLAALLLAYTGSTVGGNFRTAVETARRDAPGHRSPNAGWPEAAMAGALGLALAGPRTYGDMTIDDAWMNSRGRQAATPDDIARALRLLRAACAVHAAGVAVIAVFSLQSVFSWAI